MEKMYIFSTYQANKTLDENMKNHVALFEYLTKKDYRPIHVAGKYKDQHEESILLMGPVEEYQDLVRGLAREFNQESILEVQPHNKFKAVLYYLSSNKEEPIGIFTDVHPIRACQQNAYSIIEGKYYVVQ